MYRYRLLAGYVCGAKRAVNDDNQREYAAKKVVAVTKTGEILPPCGACREFMMQLGSPENTEILVDSDTAVTLKDLMLYPY